MRCSAASCSKVGLLCLLAMAEATNPFCNNYGTDCNLACICALTAADVTNGDNSCGNTM